MIEKIYKQYKKHEEGVNYLFFGGMTTVLSWVTCFALAYTVMDTADPLQNTLVNFIGWVVGVTFAYCTNRKYVFKSKSQNFVKEITSFVGSRVTTLLLDAFVMWVGVNVMLFEYAIVKVFSGVLVVVANYVLSKLIVFRGTEKTQEETAEPTRAQYTEKAVPNPEPVAQKQKKVCPLSTKDVKRIIDLGRSWQMAMEFTSDNGTVEVYAPGKLAEKYPHQEFEPANLENITTKKVVKIVWYGGRERAMEYNGRLKNRGLDAVLHTVTVDGAIEFVAKP